MNGQLEGHITRNDIYAAVQRIRNVVSLAETYNREALHKSSSLLMQDMAAARAQLEESLQLFEGAAIRANPDRN